MKKNELCLEELRDFKVDMQNFVKSRNVELVEAIDELFRSEEFNLLRDKAVIDNYKLSIENLFKS